jgi:hypothetical protein
MLKYVTYRLCGLDVEEAFDAIGMEGGDDSLEFLGAIPPETFVEKFSKVCEHYQVIPKTIIREYGEPVQFLSRWWNPWAGEPDSMADVPRQMAKLHVTPRVPASPVDKLREKAFSYYLTDKNTPVLGWYCSYVLEKLGVPTRRLESVASWWSRFDADDQFPNQPSDWMLEVVAREYPDFRTDVFLNAIREGVDPLHFPCCLHNDAEPIPQKVPTVQGEEIVPVAGETANDAASQETSDRVQPGTESPGDSPAKAGTGEGRRRPRSKGKRSHKGASKPKSQASGPSKAMSA